MKIIYCIDSINNIGGIQRVTVTKANALAAIPGNDVWVIVADNSGKRVFDISPEVHFVDLQVNYYEDDWKSGWYVLKGIFIKRRIHARVLRKALNEIKPDIVISVGQSEKNCIPFFRGNWATIREFHYVRNYRNFQTGSVLNRLLSLGGNALDRIVLKNYDGIVALTYEDKALNWCHQKNVHVIPNPVCAYSLPSSLESKRIIAVGRLTYQKNFSSLIRAFSSVVRQFPEWTLDIYGEGDEWDSLSAEIQAFGLTTSVRLMGSRTDIQGIMQDYSLFALTSKFEGFSLALLEAMSCGLPVVSYACPCGPKDIITDGVDGFLVPVGDEMLLAERICRLIENKELRKRMGAASYERSKDFAIERIIQKWMILFEDLMRQKRR